MSSSIYSAGRPKSPVSPRKLLKGVFPVDDMFTPEEIPLYDTLIDHYLDDFKDDDLTASDIDDIASLATNRILELRLLKESKTNPAKHTVSIEKLRKHTDALKAGLSSRRKDRINPNDNKGFSIVDLAMAFDDARRQKLEDKAKELSDEVATAREAVKDYGNRHDLDLGDKDVE